MLSQAFFQHVRDRIPVNLAPRGGGHDDHRLAAQYIHRQARQTVALSVDEAVGIGDVAGRQLHCETGVDCIGYFSFEYESESVFFVRVGTAAAATAALSIFSNGSNFLGQSRVHRFVAEDSNSVHALGIEYAVSDQLGLLDRRAMFRFEIIRVEIMVGRYHILLLVGAGFSPSPSSSSSCVPPSPRVSIVTLIFRRRISVHDNCHQ
mmetsp:Transcript_1608/g.3519  ORF Transcript_1608/g.3519 Transcript_1608/m.3519 type:complete len:206 (-) Transcript_1608:163-780(-)